MQFSLFDQVQLTQPIDLKSGFSNALNEIDVAPVGTSGTIVEVLSSGQAFLVEFFGDWVKLRDREGLMRAKEEDKGAFRETIGVEVIYPQQMVLRHRSNAVKASLFQLLDEMPENLLEEVQTFAESLRHEQGVI